MPLSNLCIAQFGFHSQNVKKICKDMGSNPTELIRKWDNVSEVVCTHWSEWDGKENPEKRHCSGNDFSKLSVEFKIIEEHY